MRFFTGRLWRDRRGATAMEFGLAAPVIFLFVAGILEVGLYIFGLTLLEASVRESSRYGITGASPSGVSREQAIRNIVGARTIGLIDMDRLVITTMVYSSFTQIGQAEPFTDTAPFNGVYDAGEPFTDVNGNGRWDPDMGSAGVGGPGDVVVYTLTYPWPLLTGLLNDLIGESGFLTLRASIAVRNEPYPEP
jgi:Flp pilus assembly protein TadG